MAEPLAGYRIVDLSWGVAGPIGTMLLAEQGAEVIKVEPPGGDPFRATTGYHVWNRSKKSVVLDLTSAGGKDAFLALLATSDALVESFAPGTMERLGLGYEQLKDTYPRLVYLSLPGYPSASSRAQRPGYDPLVAAWSGQQYTQEAIGRPDGPAYLYMPMPSMASCFLVASAINVALYNRERTGRGQRVETSLLQGTLLYTTMLWQHQDNPPPGGILIPKTNNTTLYECADGLWIHVLTGAKGSPDRLNAILGLPPLGDPRAAMMMTAEERLQRREMEKEAVRTFTRDELLRRCWEDDVPAQPVQPMDALYDDPQFVANGMTQRVADPELGETTQIGVPFTLEYAKGSIKGGQPTVGQHTREVLTELGLPPEKVDALLATGARA